MKRISLYDRLPVIYRTEDAKQNPPYQLRAFIEGLEDVFSELHEDIEGLYHNFFIESCDPWVIPYIGDLVGASHLAGDSKTLRADVAETVAIRRRKGSVESIDRLVTALTGWPTLVVELRERLAWCQHLNHFRPDAGGRFPQNPRGGTLSLRKPEELAYLSSAYEKASRTADLRPPLRDEARVNVPNVAVYLWRTRLFQIHRAEAGFVEKVNFNSNDFDVVRISLHTLGRTNKGRPQRLFCQKGPLLRDDLNSEIRVNSEKQDVALNIHMPPSLGNVDWEIQGFDLCRWNQADNFPLKSHKILVDPKLGRVVLTLPKDAAKNEVLEGLRFSYWIGAPGDVGAVPVSKAELPAPWNENENMVLRVRRGEGPSFQEQLEAACGSDKTVVIEIADSGTYELNLSESLKLKKSILIRASADMRPTLLLKKPLRFRPLKIAADPLDDEAQQEKIDLANAELSVCFEGILIGRHESWQGNDKEMISGLALNQITFKHCTLDPLGYRKPHGERVEGALSFNLKENFGLTDNNEIQRLRQRPRIVLERSITGAIRCGPFYGLHVVASIIDGVASASVDSPQGENASDPSRRGPTLEVHGATLIGDSYVHAVSGEGGIFSQKLVVWDTQVGCLSFSSFLDVGSRLPRVHACDKRKSEDPLSFSSVAIDSPGYCQLSRNTKVEILEQGPPQEGSFGDQMGVYGYLMETQKWKNLQIRIREYNPVGTVLMMVPVQDFY